VSCAVVHFCELDVDLPAIVDFSGERRLSTSRDRIGKITNPEEFLPGLQGLSFFGLRIRRRCISCGIVDLYVGLDVPQRQYPINRLLRCVDFGNLRLLIDVCSINSIYASDSS